MTQRYTQLAAVHSALSQDWLTQLRFHVRHKMGHFADFGDALPSQSLSLVPKRLSLTQWNQTAQQKMAKQHKSKPQS